MLSAERVLGGSQMIRSCGANNHPYLPTLTEEGEASRRQQPSKKLQRGGKPARVRCMPIADELGGTRPSLPPTNCMDAPSVSSHALL